MSSEIILILVIIIFLFLFLTLLWYYKVHKQLLYVVNSINSTEKYWLYTEYYIDRFYYQNGRFIGYQSILKYVLYFFLYQEGMKKMEITDYYSHLFILRNVVVDQ